MGGTEADPVPAPPAYVADGAFGWSRRPRGPYDDFVNHTTGLLAPGTAVAVSGAAGGIGRALTAVLAEGGLRVAALVRRDPDAEALAHPHVRVCLGDVRQPETLDRWAEGAEVVFHLAAWTGRPARPDLARTVNVDGTRHVVEAAARAGARRVVLASTIAVCGPVRTGTVDESTPTWSVGDPYADSKIEAERVAWDLAGRLGLELVVLRPTIVYGPATPSWTLAPYEVIRRGLPFVLGDGSYLLDAVYVDDVAEAFRLAGAVPGAAGETLHVGGETVDWNAFAGAYADMAGTRLRRLPAGLAWGAATAAARVSRAITGRSAVVPELVGVLSSRARFPHDRARDVLGYRPTYDLAAGMRATEDWLRQRGLSRRPRTALVTGAAGGLGRAVALRLRQRGLAVAACDLHAAGLESLAAEGVRTYAADLTADGAAEDLVRRVALDLGAVDLLVNVAGVLLPGPLEQQPWEDVACQFEVNAFAPLRLARAAAPDMRRRGFGRIVNVTSTNGVLATPFMGAYSASKFALEALSDSLRLELAPFGVEVAVMTPGAMRTTLAQRAKAWVSDRAEGSPDWAPHVRRFLASGVWGASLAADPDVVAARIVAVALARRMPPRRAATWDVLPVRWMATLPTPIRDAYFRRAVGLRSPRR